MMSPILEVMALTIIMKVKRKKMTPLKEIKKGNIFKSNILK